MSLTATPLSLKQDSEPIPGYILRERLGAGGRGEVWSVTAPDGLLRAIKVLRGGADQRWAAQGIASLELVQKLPHPFLLDLDHIEIIGGHIFVVSELADHNLRHQFLARCNAGEEGIPRTELIEYLREAAEALDYLSASHSLQHLDVKPENILLVDRHVKMSDFGLNMTPKYAPPELFDGEPSRFSDQYSLAIVYCEMATGRTPFAGETAAVLASQHLYDAPELDHINRSERATIERALAKIPEQRFDNCREFINHLSGADATSVLINAKESDSVSIDRLAASRPGGATEARRPHSPADDSQRGENKNDTVPYASEMSDSLPASEPDSQPCQFRPAIFLGLGGTGIQVLGHLKQLFQERFTSDFPLPAFRFLGIDTDPATVNAAANGNNSCYLQSNELLLLPLRSGSDYRKGPISSLASVNRRLLHNFPRSQRTEGIRAFGRIALLDHVQTAVDHLRAAISAATCPEAVEQTSENTGLPMSVADPRVFFIASLGGGTGSGLLLDLSYALRQSLLEAGLSDQDVYGLLTYSTARGNKSPCLETGNAYACLEELKYFCAAERDYPGESSCGLRGFHEDRTALPHIYLVETDGLGESETYELQVVRLARYAFLNTASPAAPGFDECRVDERPPSRQGQFSLRSINIVPLTADTANIPSAWIERVCHSVVLHWEGRDRDSWSVPLEPNSHMGDSRSAAEQLSKLHAPKADDAEHLSAIDELVGRWIADCLETVRAAHRMHTNDEVALSLSLAAPATEWEMEPFLQAIDEAFRHASGLNLRLWVDEELGRVRTDCVTKLDSNGFSGAETVAQLNLFHGLEDDVAPGSDHTAQSLSGRVASKATAVTQVIEASMLGRLIELADHGPGGASAAAQVAKRMVAMLASAIQDVEGRLHTLQTKRREWAAKLSKLGQTRWLDQRPSIEAHLKYMGEFGQLVYEEAICQCGSVLLSKLRTSGSQCLSQLHEFTRFLEGIRTSFQDSSDADVSSHKRDLPGQDSPNLIDSAAQIFGNNQEDITHRLDQEIRSRCLTSDRPLTDLLTLNDECEIVDRMRAAAGQVIIQSIQDIARAQVEALLGNSDDPKLGLWLEHVLKTVTPSTLESSGGNGRLLLLGPDDDVVRNLKEQLELVYREEIAQIHTPSNEILLCCEAHGLEFEDIATQLMASQPDCRELASQLHVRNDIPW